MLAPVHPFDRYAAFTDLAALKTASDRPLRKSLRVNTLKSSVEKFKQWAVEHEWTLQPVRWCPEAFFVDRAATNAAGEEREALGKDLLHLLGHTYMQEAASMLPVALLDPQPGETVLDMSAAPGSKTTQIASRMQTRGVIVANDVQEKRLWTLKSSLHRCGVMNVIVTKKVGQWFAKHMTERFDRVLVDAPCTAQGTSRKDSDALMYCSLDNIGKMARLQRELLESGVHAAKVGGTIVYSTCTLTPEENEETVRSILNKFSDQLECVDPGMPELRCALEDSAIVQRSLGFERILPMIRLWPQTYDTEGFFCSILRKVVPTKHPEQFEFIRSQEELTPRTRQKQFGETLVKNFGTSFLRDDEQLFERTDQLLLATKEVAEFRMPVQDYSLGIPFATRLDDGRLRVSHELATLRGLDATRNVCTIDDAQLTALFEGRDTTCDPILRGDCVLQFRGVSVGMGLAKEGRLKNRLPRWLVAKS